MDFFSWPRWVKKGKKEASLFFFTIAILSAMVIRFFPPFKGYLGGGFKYVLFSPLPGEMIQFDEHIFQMDGSTTN